MHWRRALIISSEADVRQWVKGLGLPVWWIEAAQGGTLGFPDCLIVKEGVPWFCELKLGVMGDDGVLRFKLRPAQRVTLSEMDGAGLIVKVIVGAKGSERVVVLGWCKSVGEGWARLG